MSVPSPAIMSYPNYMTTSPGVAASGAGAGAPITMLNVNSLLNQKDSRWLQLEVCREYQRQKCSRPDGECKFAHPPANVEVQNGRVTACYDSIKARCNREKPACKYFHPPQHLKDQLLINGRNHLALKNALAAQIHQQILPGQIPTLYGSPYMGAAQLPMAAYSPYLQTAGLMSPLIDATGGVAQAPPTPTQQQLAAKRNETLANGSLVPYKRQAAASDKTGQPVYQPHAQPVPTQPQPQQHQIHQFQQLIQMQPSLVPVTYGGGPQSLAVPRFQH